MGQAKGRIGTRGLHLVTAFGDEDRLRAPIMGQRRGRTLKLHSASVDSSGTSEISSVEDGLVFTEERAELAASDRAEGLSQQEVAAWRTLHAGDTRESPTNTNGTIVVFRPYRKAFLASAVVILIVTLLNLWCFGVNEPFSVYGIVNVPGFVLIGIGFGGTAGLLYLYGWSCLSDYEITLDDGGIILPKEGRLTWDQIAEVRAFGLAMGGIVGMTRLTLNDGKRIYVQWFQTGCRPSKFYEVVQLVYECARRREETEASHR